MSLASFFQHSDRLNLLFAFGAILLFIKPFYKAIDGLFVPPPPRPRPEFFPAARQRLEGLEGTTLQSPKNL